MSRLSRPLSLFVLLSSLIAVPVAAETWVRVAGGLSHMAMGDIGGAKFNFYADPAAEATFADVGTGGLLDLAVGHDFSRNWGVGFHWDRQWAVSQATDRGVDGELDLDANFFSTRGYWRPLHGDSWYLGLVAGVSYFFTTGKTQVTRGNTNYGESDLWGNGVGFDAALLGSWRLTDSADLQVQFGGRYAVIPKFEIDKRVVHRADGTDAELDYSGWVLKAGVRWSLGDSDDDRDTGL